MGAAASRPVRADGDDRSALVLGAGIAGLAAARSLRRAGWQVTVLEAAQRVGGVLTSITLGGCHFECGPNTVQASDELLALCQDAGCANGLQPTAARAARRYLVRDGALVALPASPWAFITTPLFSRSGKLRLLTEPLRGRGPGPHEPLADFVRRRLGPEAVSIIDALAHGVYAGDARELAVGYAFPKVYRLEAEHGSLVRGMLRVRSKIAGPGGPKSLIGFAGGFEALAGRLGRDLDIRLGTRALRVEHDGRRFRLLAESDAGPQRFAAARLVSALPAAPAVSVLAPLGDLGPAGDIPHAPVAVVNLVFDRDALGHALDGFGFLAPAGAGLPILGCLFISTLFPDRAPPGKAALTVMLGGRQHAEQVDLDDPTLVRVAIDALGGLLAVRAAPLASHVTHWRQGIAQATAAWPAAQAAGDALEAAYPGLSVLGSWRSGVGVPNCVRAGWQVAGSAVRW